MLAARQKAGGWVAWEPRLQPSGLASKQQWYEAAGTHGSAEVEHGETTCLGTRKPGKQ